MDCTYILLVTNCIQREHLATEQYNTYLSDVHKYPIRYIRYVGDPCLNDEWVFDEQHNLLTVRSKDDYVNLSHKLRLALKAIHSLFPDIKGVFKTDDDIQINIKNLYDILETHSDCDYFGKVIDGKSYCSNYLQSKTYVYEIYPILKKSLIHVVDGSYCAGGGFYISRKAINYIINDPVMFNPFPSNYMDYYDTGTTVFYNLFVFDDKNVGVLLHSKGIQPVNIDISKAVWWKGI